MSRKLLKKLHWYGGLFLLLIFLLTGAYMHVYHNHLQGMEDSLRMQYRSIHIYILFSSLMHILLGVFVRFSRFDLYRLIQFFGSFLLFSASILLLIGFFTEIPAIDLQRNLTSYGVYVSLGGTALLTLPQFIKKNRY